MAEAWDAIVGKHVLVGMTYVDYNEDVIEQKHGVIVSADEVAVYVSAPDSSEPFWLPPHLESFQEAVAGDYRLRETGEIVSDPDLLATYTIYPPWPGRFRLLCWTVGARWRRIRGRG